MEKLTIEERKQKFADDMRTALGKDIEKVPRFVLNDFYYYWTEMNPNGKKMRWEKESTFDIRRRIKTWMTNAENWGQLVRTIKQNKKLDESKLKLD